MPTDPEPAVRGVDALEQLAYLIAQTMVDEFDQQLAETMLTKENFRLMCERAPYEAQVRKAGC